MNQLDVYRERPRQWALSVPVIPTTWVNEGGAKQLACCSRLSEKEFDRSSSDVECVMSRKIVVWDASAMCCTASAASEVTSELSYSLLGMRKELHNWEVECRQVFINHKPESSTLVCCRERELCGIVHDRFIIESDSVQLTCTESRLKKG